VAVTATAGALSWLTVAQRAAARDGIVTELRADVVESSIQVLIAGGFGRGEELELRRARQVSCADAEQAYGGARLLA
jgi:hypothetical protein